jgi:hypothetical protein
MGISSHAEGAWAVGREMVTMKRNIALCGHVVSWDNRPSKMTIEFFASCADLRVAGSPRRRCASGHAGLGDGKPWKKRPSPSKPAAPLRVGA